MSDIHNTRYTYKNDRECESCFYKVREGEVAKSNEPYCCPVCGLSLEKLHEAKRIATIDVNHDDFEMHMVEAMQNWLEEKTPETTRIEVSPIYD